MRSADQSVPFDRSALRSRPCSNGGEEEKSAGSLRHPASGQSVAAICIPAVLDQTGGVGQAAPPSRGADGASLPAPPLPRPPPVRADSRGERPHHAPRQAPPATRCGGHSSLLREAGAGDNLLPWRAPSVPGVGVVAGGRRARAWPVASQTPVGARIAGRRARHAAGGGQSQNLPSLPVIALSWSPSTGG